MVNKRTILTYHKAKDIIRYKMGVHFIATKDRLNSNQWEVLIMKPSKLNMVQEERIVYYNLIWIIVESMDKKPMI